MVEAREVFLGRYLLGKILPPSLVFLFNSPVRAAVLFQSLVNNLQYRYSFNNRKQANVSLFRSTLNTGVHLQHLCAPWQCALSTVQLNVVCVARDHL